MKQNRALTEQFSNKILMLFKEGLEMTDLDTLNLIKIESILEEYATKIVPDPKSSNKKIDLNTVWVVNFESVAVTTTGFQIWQRGERKEIVDYELSRNLNIPEEEWSHSVYNYQAVVRAKDEKEARKIVMSEAKTAKITNVEQVDIYELKSIPMFANIKID